MTYFAIYNFNVDDENMKYKISVGNYEGNAGDSLQVNNGMYFSTKDQANDKLKRGSCARQLKGGFWYNKCGRSNINGGDVSGRTENDIIYWGPLNDRHNGIPLDYVEMFILRK